MDKHVIVGRMRIEGELGNKRRQQDWYARSSLGHPCGRDAERVPAETYFEQDSMEKIPNTNISTIRGAILVASRFYISPEAR